MVLNTKTVTSFSIIFIDYDDLWTKSKMKIFSSLWIDLITYAEKKISNHLYITAGFLTLHYWIVSKRNNNDFDWYIHWNLFIEIDLRTILNSHLEFTIFDAIPAAPKHMLIYETFVLSSVLPYFEIVFFFSFGSGVIIIILTVVSIWGFNE